VTVELRPAGQADQEFLCRVYGSTRTDELTLVDWTEAQKEAFVRHQFEAQDRHYREHYPTAAFDVIVEDGEPIGRLYVDRWPEEIRVMDIALLPEHRGNGVGTALLGGLLDEAAASGKAVSIHVEQFNPAMRLYLRLGFAPVGVESGIHVLMRWTPPTKRAT
jgi:GNAT superfamily N-acetyltransferase